MTWQAYRRPMGACKLEKGVVIMECDRSLQLRDCNGVFESRGTEFGGLRSEHMFALECSE